VKRTTGFLKPRSTLFSSGLPHTCVPAKDGYLSTFDTRDAFKETGQYITPDEMRGALDAHLARPAW